MKATPYLYYCLIVFSIISCKNKEINVQSSKLEGNWSLTYGELDGKESPALESIYFIFAKDSLKTNFTLSEQDETGTFSLTNDKLIQKTAETIEYKIESQSDSTIEMSTALRGFDFKLVLQKNELQE